MSITIAGRARGGRPLGRRREMVLIRCTGGCEGPQPSRNRWREPGMGAIAGRGAGGRPLRRRREMVLMSLHRRLRGPSGETLWTGPAIRKYS
jgi:hypothetical protein